MPLLVDMSYSITSVALIVVLTLLSGLGDALGFVHAGRVWDDGRFVWLEACKSAVAFQLGAIAWWVALKYLATHGVVAVEVQAIIWFAATMLGIALLSRRFFLWPPADQCAAIAVLVGVAWLVVRTAQHEAV